MLASLVTVRTGNTTPKRRGSPWSTKRTCEYHKKKQKIFNSSGIGHRATARIELATSSTLRMNHTTRPSGLRCSVERDRIIQGIKIILLSFANLYATVRPPCTLCSRILIRNCSLRSRAQLGHPTAALPLYPYVHQTKRLVCAREHIIPFQKGATPQIFSITPTPPFAQVND